MAKTSNHKKIEKNEKKAPRRKARGGMIMITGVVLVLCFIITYSSFGLRSQLRENAAVEADLEAQISEQEEVSQDLERESEYIRSDDYIEELARERLGLVHDNEIVFQKQDETSAQ